MNFQLNHQEKRANRHKKTLKKLISVFFYVHAYSIKLKGLQCFESISYAKLTPSSVGGSISFKG